MTSRFVRASASLVLPLAALASLAACSSDGGSPTASASSKVRLSFSTAAAGTSAATVAGTDGHSIVVTRAQLVLARIELQRAGATACATTTAAAGDDDSGRVENEGCAELELAPTLVELPVTGGVASSLTVDVPAGSYASLEAKIAPVGASTGHHGAGSSAFLAAHPDLAGVSVRVEGTFDGRPFVYVGAPWARLESVFDPPLAVASGGASLTIGVDLASWFRAADGSLIDPATALPGTVAGSVVAGNVVRSFAAFRDDDRDGRDDSGGHDRSTSGADDGAGDDHGGDA